jgi:DNA gyrase subunit A
VCSNVGSADDKLIIMTANGIAIRMKLSDIRSCGRGTMGVRLIQLDEGDKVASVAVVFQKQEES